MREAKDDGGCQVKFENGGKMAAGCGRKEKKGGRRKGKKRMKERRKNENQRRSWAWAGGEKR